MARQRPRGVLQMGWACFASAVLGRPEHAPPCEAYPSTLIERIWFQAGGGHGWKLSALRSPRQAPAPWKIVVVTGAPSWAEYWAEAIIDLPTDREMVVVDRPGYACSEPAGPVLDLYTQAEALMPLLKTAPGQKLILVGQSYGAAIATLMARMAPRKVDRLMLLSAFFGERGPTAKWLVDLGAPFLSVIPKDLRNAILEVQHQPPQLEAVRQAFARLKTPVHVVHGAQDDFAPLEVTKTFAEQTIGKALAQFRTVPAANHFLNDGPTEILLAEIEAAIALAEPEPIPLWKRSLGAIKGLAGAPQPGLRLAS